MSRCNLQHKIKPHQAGHAGLWFDRYFRGAENAKAKQDHVHETSEIAEPELYQTFFSEWKSWLTEIEGCQLREAKTLGRLAMGLGNGSVIETAITLQHTYGLPYIPGSALKGLTAHYAQNRLDDEWKKGTRAYEILFGYTGKPNSQGRPVLSEAGYVTFFDALYVPGTGKSKRALQRDIVTVHHPNYYSKDTPETPADWDSPDPIPFLSTSGTFLLAIAGHTPWVNAAYTILAHALIEVGVGAKTSSGYGRMEIEDASSHSIVDKWLQRKRT